MMPTHFEQAFRAVTGGLRTPVIIWAGVSLGLVAVNAFGIVSLFGRVVATIFWMGLVGLNMTAWFAWRRAMPTNDRGWTRIVFGAVLLNGLLAVEVPVLYRLLGRTDVPLDWRPPVYGLFVTAFVVFLVRQVKARHSASEVPIAPAVTVRPAQPVAILTRAGVADVADVLWVRAEDHYCRLGIRGRDSVLIHYRFRDAVDDLRSYAGVQVHRSAWVADHAVVEARRSGRRWMLNLIDGASVPVSETSVALCRTRGWSGLRDGMA